MSNKVTHVYTGNSTWTAPAGVNWVKVLAQQSLRGLRANANGCVDQFNNLYLWGINTNGEIGNGAVVSQSSPVLVLGGLSWSRLLQSYGGVPGAGGCYTGLTLNGTAYSWGNNNNGNLGVGDSVPRSSPVAVLGGYTFQDIAIGGGQNLLGLTPSGDAYAWGANGQGMLGVGDLLPRSSPVLVLGGLKWGSLFATDNYSFGITTAGALYAWGYNGSGALGVGDVVRRSSPVAVLGGLTFKTIALGNQTDSLDFAVGLTTAGAAYAWGVNPKGNLGVGDVTPRSSPVLVLGGLTFASVSIDMAGSVYGLQADGTLYAWGFNSKGQLGVGDVTPRSSPVLVLGGLKFAFVRTANASNGTTGSVIGVTAAGVAYAWGENLKGCLGVGDSTARSSPVLVLGGLTFSDLVFSQERSPGNPVVYGLDTTGKLWSWGANSQGELAVGDTVARSSPVAVIGSKSARLTVTQAPTEVPVIPGTAYAINMTQFISTFGGIPVATGKVDTITLVYDN